MTTARATVSVKAPENDLNYIWNWDSLKYVCGYYEITLEWSAPNWICKSILSRTTRTLRQGARVRPVRLPPSTKHWIRSTRQANVLIKLIQLTPLPAASYCFMFFTLFISESVGQTNALKITQGRRSSRGLITLYIHGQLSMPSPRFAMAVAANRKWLSCNPLDKY